MTKPENDAPLDPKEQMRQALEAKKQASHKAADGGGADRSVGHTQGQAAAKRQFRRKSGG